MVRRPLRLGRDRDGRALQGRAVPETRADLPSRFARIRAELGIPDAFPPHVLAEAADAAGRAPVTDADLRDVPFVTVDPPGATDLDQALHLTVAGDGFRLLYAIADVPAFVEPAGAVAVEAARRGQTLYSPDLRTPLHPPVLSEDAASLLEGRDRPAYVWRLTLDARGSLTSADVLRAVVRSRSRLDYAGMQALADANPDPEPERSPGDLARWLDTTGIDGPAAQAVLLRAVGRRRIELERSRGGAGLPMPEQEVEETDEGYRVRLRPALAAEDWNAQLSLTTGMAAAAIMLRGGVGLLRTLPEPDHAVVDRFRRQADALGVPWLENLPYGEFLRGLDLTDPARLALVHEAGALFRGAAYTPFDGTEPAVRVHAAVAAPYAHVTAPLRRLVDRFGLACCHALSQGLEVPEWVREALPALPAAMRASDRLAGELERRCLDQVEAAVLAGSVGRDFDAVVVEVRRGGESGQVQVIGPPVLAGCDGPLRLGEPVRVRLTDADPDTGRVRFAAAPPREPGRGPGGYPGPADEPDGRPRRAG